MQFDEIITFLALILLFFILLFDVWLFISRFNLKSFDVIEENCKDWAKIYEVKEDIAKF